MTTKERHEHELLLERAIAGAEANVAWWKQRLESFKGSKVKSTIIPPPKKDSQS